MPGKNKDPLLGWHPPAAISVWVREEAQRRGANISAVLNEAVEVYRWLSVEAGRREISVSDLLPDALVAYRAATAGDLADMVATTATLSKRKDDR